MSMVQRALKSRQATAKAKTAAEQARREGRPAPRREPTESFDPYAVRDPRAEAAMPLAAPGTGPLPTPEKNNPLGMKPLAAPYVVPPEHKNMIEEIFRHAEQNRSPDYTEAREPIFDPPDPNLTRELVDQRSIASRLPRKPGLDETLPAGERSRPILENEEAIGRKFADWIRTDPNEPVNFYATGTVIQGLIDKAGLSPDEANAFMKDWAGQGAATSPRTGTEQNLRNAAYLLFRNATGDRLTAIQQRLEQGQGKYGVPKEHNWKMDKKTGEAVQPNLNRPGFAMMGMHTKLGEDFFNDTVDPLKNPKPYTFQQNWSGNMADTTADTHYIRSVLDAFNEIAPGEIPRGWFKTDAAYDDYKVNGAVFDTGQMDVGKIKDGLEGSTVNKQYSQTEYPIMQGPSMVAAEELGLQPAEVQERLWFNRGHRTGLQSPRRGIPDLFNSQIEYTARVLGIPQEEVLKLFAKHKIPLAEADVSDVPGASSVG